MNISKRAVLAVALAVGFSSAAWSGAPSIGLGQAWPNAADVSLSPHYHVYRFNRDGIQYIQINTQNGTVLAAIGTAGNQYIVLPVGQSSQQVATPQQAASTIAQPAGSTTTVYNDGTTQVTVTPLSDGTVLIRAASPDLESTCGDPATCGTKGGA